jgi:hypothetical protein
LDSKPLQRLLHHTGDLSAADFVTGKASSTDPVISSSRLDRWIQARRVPPSSQQLTALVDVAKAVAALLRTANINAAYTGDASPREQNECRNAYALSAY